MIGIAFHFHYRFIRRDNLLQNRSAARTLVSHFGMKGIEQAQARRFSASLGGRTLPLVCSVRVCVDYARTKTETSELGYGNGWRTVSIVQYTHTHTSRSIIHHRWDIPEKINCIVCTDDFIVSKRKPSPRRSGQSARTHCSTDSPIYEINNSFKSEYLCGVFYGQVCSANDNTTIEMREVEKKCGAREIRKLQELPCGRVCDIRCDIGVRLMKTISRAPQQRHNDDLDAPTHIS